MGAYDDIYAEPREHAPGSLAEIQVREATLSRSTWFLLLWGLAFGGVPLLGLISTTADGKPVYWLAAFVAIGGLAVAHFIYKAALCVLIRIRGTDMQGTVVGYRNDMSSSGATHVPDQIALVQVTIDGRRVLLCYQTLDSFRPFAVGDTVDVRMWGDIVRVTSTWNGIAPPWRRI